MDPSKLTEMIRDYLYLTGNNLRKTEYQRRITLVSAVLTNVLMPVCKDDEDCIDEYRRETSCLRHADMLFTEYTKMVVEHLARWLDTIIEPYECPGSGDTYRHYAINREQDTGLFTLALVGDKPNEQQLQEWISNEFCYPIKVKIELVDHVTSGPTWRSYYY